MNVFYDWQVTSGYGYRTHPVDLVRKHHNGVDLVKQHRAPITPFMPGIVKRVGGMGTAGIVVIISDDLFYEHRYYHLDKHNAFVGQVVGWNDVIGYQGETGKVTGSHLHYEIRDRVGNPINPREYLEGRYMEFQKEIDELKEQVKLLTEAVDLLTWTEPPEWFKKEFEKIPVWNIIHDKRGTPDFWRTVAILKRMIENDVVPRINK